MRKLWSFLFCTAIVAMLFCASSASAATYIYEPFDYTSGADLLGQTNTSAGTTAGAVPNSWLRAAPTASPATAIKIGTGSLATPAEANTLKSPIGNDLTITGSTLNAADRLAFKADTTTASNITTGSIYYSFLLNVSSLTNMQAGTTGGDYFISLNNTANAATTANPTVHPAEMRVKIDTSDSTKYDLGMFTQRSPTNTDAAWSNVGTGALSLDVNRTYFVVGQFNIGSSNSTKLWINPDQTFFGGATAASITRQDTTSGSNGTTIGSILLHQRQVGTLALDELRVGSTWAEVTPLGTATLYWVGSGGASPNGTWDTNAGNPVWNNAADGSGNAVPWTADSVAVFSAGNTATGAYTVTVSGTQSTSTMTFEDGTPTLSGGTVNLTGLHTINANTGVTATIGSAIGGTVGMVKDGSGTLVLTGNQSYSGATVVSGGVLQVGSGGTTGSLPTGSAITDSARVTFNRSNAVTQGTDFSGSAISGSGGLTQAGSGTLTLNTANTFSGTTRATAGTILLTDSLALQNSTLDMNGTDTGAVSLGSLSAVTLGGLTGSRNLTLQGSSADYNGNGIVDAGDYVLWRKSPNSYGGDPGGYNAWRAQFGSSGSGALALSIGNSITSPAAPYSGVLSGSGTSLTKIGTNTQVLSGANTYNGGTNINAGTLQFGKTFAMPLTGNVTVNSSGTLAVNAGGTDEWTSSAVTTDPGSLAGLIAGKGGQGTANQVTWNSGSAFGVDTTNAPIGTNSAPELDYSGVIGSFRTSSGTTDAVGFTKRGLGRLVSTGNNTFSGQLTVTGGTADTDDTTRSTLVLNGTNLNAGTTMTIPTVSIGAFSTLELGVSNTLPSGSLISLNGTKARFHLDDSVAQTVRSLSGTNGIIEVGLGKLTINDQAGDNYVLGIPGGAYIQTSDGVFDPNKGIVDKIGAGTLTLEGDAGTNFNGTFIMENGTLKLSRNQALGSGGSSRLYVKGGQLARSDTPTGNFTYSLAFLDLDVFRYDLSDDSARTSQINAGALTTLKQNDVEFNITNSGTQTPSSGRFNFLGDIRNHDPNPSAGDDSNAIRGITKTGNGVLTIAATTTYKGSTTVQDGVLLVSTTASTLGDYTQATIGTLYLKGGVLASNLANNTLTIKNPVVVDSTTGTATLEQFSTGASASTVMEFSNDSVVGTSGSLTIANVNTNNNTATVFQPRFTGQGFNFGRPIIISDSVLVGTGVKSNELQFGNTTGTQTFSGVISGGGSVRRVNAGGTTILSGLNSYTGTTSVDAGTLSITNPYLADGADVRLTTGGIFDLNFTGTDTISRLFFDGVSQAIGTYGATGSGATFINDTFFTGSGVLNVTVSPGSGAGLGVGAVPEPGSLSLMIFGISSALISCSRRLNRRRS